MVGGVLAGLATLVSGCTRSPEDQAQATADRLYPGQLRVISASRDIGGPVPVPIIRARYAVVDDPDAIVEVARLTDDLLRAAVEHGRWVADDLRSLERAFADESLTLAAMSRPDPAAAGRRGTIQVGAELTDRTRATVLGQIDRAMAVWHAERSAILPLDLLQLDLVPPSEVAAAPRPEPDLPRVAMMTHPDRVNALRAASSWSCSVGKDADGQLVAPSSRLAPRLSEPESVRLGEAVRSAVTQWLVDHDEPGSVPGDPPLAWSFVLPEGLHLLRTYALVCPPELDSCNTFTFAKIIGCTVDLDDLGVDDITALDLEPRPGGGVDIPLEPDRSPD